MLFQARLRKVQVGTSNRAYVFSNRYDATERMGFGFFKTFLVWHGSIFRLIWLHIILYVCTFASLSMLYRFVLIKDAQLRQGFELICIYCSR